MTARYGEPAQQHSSISSHTDVEGDSALLNRLKEAIVQGNSAAVLCIKTAAKDCSEEQWERVFSQLDSRHQAYVQQKTEQHNDELRELQDTVKRNLATERRLLDEQLANHRSAIGASADCAAEGNICQTGSGRKSRDYRELVSQLSVEERRHLCDHLAEPGTVAAEAQGHAAVAVDESSELSRLRAALSARERDLVLAEDRLARSRRLCDTLLGRLTAAEAELQFLRNRRTDRRVSVSLLGGDDGECGGNEQAPSSVGDTSGAAADSLRRSLVELERRQLIDTADALELSGDPVELERRYDCLQVERREIEAALTRVPRPGSVHHTWHSARDQELLEQKLDNIDRELVHLRNSLKQFQLI